MLQRLGIDSSLPTGSFDMVLDKRKVVSTLRKKGFEKDTGGHHVVMTYRRIDGVMSNIRTHVSHGNTPKVLDDYLIGQMAQQTKLSKKDFERLANCPMKRSKYEEVVKDYL